MYRVPFTQHVIVIIVAVDYYNYNYNKKKTTTTTIFLLKTPSTRFQIKKLLLLLLFNGFCSNSITQLNSTQLFTLCFLFSFMCVNLKNKQTSTLCFSINTLALLVSNHRAKPRILIQLISHCKYSHIQRLRPQIRHYYST